MSYRLTGRAPQGADQALRLIMAARIGLEAAKAEGSVGRVLVRDSADGFLSLDASPAPAVATTFIDVDEAGFARLRRAGLGGDASIYLGQLPSPVHT